MESGGDGVKQIEERVIQLYGAQISVFSDGSVWIHRGSRNKRRFGNTTDKGYKAIIIRDKGHERTVFVHRLVAMAYIPNPDNLPQVNHINGIKTDNRPNNLEWCTNEENLRHRRNVLNHYGRRTSVICVETGNMYLTIVDAEKKTGARRSNIHECIRGKRKTAGGYHWQKVGGDSN